MKQRNERFNLTQDDRLTDFADQVAQGKTKQTESNADDELLNLEKTILRLNQSLPSVSVDEATAKQMQVRLNSRIRREAQEIKGPFWKKWLAPQARSQFGFAFVIVVLLITFAIFSASSTDSGSTITATALNPAKNIFIAGILALVIAIFLWIKRPK